MLALGRQCKRYTFYYLNVFRKHKKCQTTTYNFRNKDRIESLAVVLRFLNSNTRAAMKSYDSRVVMFENMALKHDTVDKSDNFLISTH